MRVGAALRVFSIEIDCDGNGTGIKLGYKAYITTILRRFGIEHTHGVSTPMDTNVQLHLAEDRGEKELEAIRDYQPVVGSPMYAALASQLDNSVQLLLFPITIHRHMAAAKRVSWYFKSTPNLGCISSATPTAMARVVVVVESYCIDSNWSMTGP